MIDFLSKPDPSIIASYDGYANDKTFTISARVIEDEGLHTHENKNIFHNTTNFIKRLESDEKHNAHVRLKWNGQQVDLLSNKEGYIHYTGTHGLSLSGEEQYFDVAMELIQDGVTIYNTTAQIMKPADNARFIVISDMDDTVIQTGVSSTFKWKLLVNSIFKDSNRRLPLEGATEFYQALKEPSDTHGPSSFFYLSNSPWNIHDYLNDFLDAYEFPRGVLILRDFSMPKFRKLHFTKLNKYLKTVELLKYYPDKKFILIGDAAELDTDIYLSVAMAFPERIEAIYIRSVHKSKKVKRVKRLIQNNSNISISLVENSNDAMAHAKSNGYIA